MDRNRLDPDQVEEHLEELQAWLDDRWNGDEPFRLDETVKVLRDLRDTLRLLPNIPLQTVYAAAREVGLAREAELLRTLADLAAHIAVLQED